VQHVPGPSLPQAGNVGQLVPQPGRDQQPPGRDPPAADQQHPEPGRTIRYQAGSGALEDLAAIALHLSPAGGHKLCGREPVAWQEAVHVRGRRVARHAAVDDQDLAAGPGQHQCCGQSGGSATDDRDVVITHDPRL
jgi:hypothetical protein